MYVMKVIISAAILMILIVGCSAEKKNMSTETASYLKENFENIGSARIGEVRTFVGDALWEYINGGAELYHQYHFVEVVTADYQTGEHELVVDIYKFDTFENAFGLYSQFRIPENTQLTIGVEGFTSPGSLNFVKGQYLVRITGYDDSSEGGLALADLAGELAELVPGTTEKPPALTKFPTEGLILGSSKYFIDSYLGHKFLAGIYCADYEADDEPISLFLTEDTDGAKYAEWINLAGEVDKKADIVNDFGFDDDNCFIFKDSYYGDIIVGLKNGHLLGIVGYYENQKSMLVQWVGSI